MTDQERFVVCGNDLAEMMPTAELRYEMRWMPMPGQDHVCEAKPVLQQKWVASAKALNGDVHGQFRWRDIPTVSMP